jgi:hypothetical protein
MVKTELPSSSKCQIPMTLQRRIDTLQSQFIPQPRYYSRSMYNRVDVHRQLAAFANDNYRLGPSLDARTRLHWRLLEMDCKVVLMDSLIYAASTCIGPISTYVLAD